MKNLKFLSALVVAGGVFFAGAMSTTTALAADPDSGGKGTNTQPADQGKDKEKEKKLAAKGAKIGDPAPAFTLTDTDGKTVKLADFKGKIVVLEWFNPGCPYIHKHHDPEIGNMTFNKLYSEYNSKDVVFLAINSSAKGMEGNGKDVNAKAKGDYKMEYPILLDEDGTVGRAYGARTTPHVFIIATDGTLAYNGAIDNSTDPKKAGDKNYAKVALDELLAGKKVSTSETKPYGCGVKYAKKS